MVILALGNFILLAIYNALSRSENNMFVANVARYASLALFAAIALSQMGLANEIVELAFGAIVVSVALVIALAYGLGDREAAGEHFKDIVSKLKGKKDDNNS